jgi:hypothetical protein
MRQHLPDEPCRARTLAALAHTLGVLDGADLFPTSSALDQRKRRGEDAVSTRQRRYQGLCMDVGVFSEMGVSRKW